MDATAFDAEKPQAVPDKRTAGRMSVVRLRALIAGAIFATISGDQFHVGAVELDHSAGRSLAQFDMSAVKELPRVDVIYSYAGADSVAIDAVVAAGARGLVVAGVGRGGMTSSQGAAVRRATARGVVVVTSTRTGSGQVPVGRSGSTIGSGDLNPQKARILLMLALSRTSDPIQVRRIFAENQ